MSTAIKVENLGKKYTLRHQQRQSYTALRDVLADGAASIARRLIHPFSTTSSVQSTKEEFWALKDVSFEVKQGDRIGIIGRNGAGKSTLLKILSRITEQTTGRVKIKGRVASLLEVGTGFHPELTGRENIYLNGAILGMSRAEIKTRFDEIVDFAEIERFLDTPVKRFSSGMYVRLAFAVAAHLDPEILVVDEVLAVGDVQFQKKCLGKMEDVGKEGRTVLFVSHNMEAVRRFCNKGLFLANGSLLMAGTSDNCVISYFSIDAVKSSVYDCCNNQNNKDWFIKKAWIKQNGKNVESITNGFPLLINIIIQGKSHKKISFEVLIKDQQQHPIIFIPLGLGLGIIHNLEPGEFAFEISVQLPFLAEGDYYIDLMIVESGVIFFDQVESALKINVINNFNEKTGWIFRQDRGQGALFIGNSNIRYIPDLFSS